MRISLPVILLLAPLALSQEKAHEIGWEEGLRYSRHFGSLSIGARFTPRFSYSEGGEDPSSMADPASQYVNTSAMNQESRGLELGIQFLRHFEFSEMIYFEPFSEVGYIFAHTEANSHSSRTARQADFGGSEESSASLSSQEGYENAGYALLGVKPGILVKERIRIYTRFGINLSLRHTRRYATNRYDRNGGSNPGWDESIRRESFTAWDFRTVGYSHFLNGVFVSLLF